ncbi:MAG: DM13 domain-containing protein [Acidimicrobiaceae bacterium]|nr:DM13 domain-containing protein [Ilumatobacter sp.]MCB9381136.1 DM13 domain-containing protein [Acidimicrobiaceae bacterium]MCO5331602.1 DM13 domain-containing protein [Ilumatobacteraceae bacterium]
MRRFLRPRILWPVGIVLAGLIAFVLLYFEPQTAFIDHTANDAPVAGTATEATEFVGLEHDGSGRVLLVTAEDGTVVVRIEGLDTSNGPDLKVYLSANPVDGPGGAFDDDAISLGGLRGNLGDQNYTVPAGTDLSRFASVVVWCDRFDAAFTAAPLPALDADGAVSG